MLITCFLLLLYIISSIPVAEDFVETDRIQIEKSREIFYFSSKSVDFESTKSKPTVKRC